MLTHTQVIPRPDPTAVVLHWRLRVEPKPRDWALVTWAQQSRYYVPPAPPESEITVQLTADQQVTLSISGKDKYGNDVDLSSGAITWKSSDESIIQVVTDATQGANTAVASAVGPVGTAAVTVTDDVDGDGTGDFQGSIAIDVVAGQLAEIQVNPSAAAFKTDPQAPPPVDPPQDNLPTDQPQPDSGASGAGTTGPLEQPTDTEPASPDAGTTPTQ